MIKHRDRGGQDTKKDLVYGGSEGIVQVSVQRKPESVSRVSGSRAA